MRTRSRPHRRRGVLLLIVLCVLFMFLLLAITYTVVASKERAMTRNYARFERSGDPPNVVLDQIFMTLVRDTNDPHCPFRSWSLLEGIYGNVSFRGTINGTPQQQAGGQFLQCAVNATNFNSTPNYYKGCVLTMLTGQCAGLSTRIVASTGGNTPSATVMRFQADAGLYDPAGGDTFLINGRPYCGMGRGYNINPANATDPANNAMDPNNWPYALLPNPVGFQPSTAYYKDTNNNPVNDPAGPGGANVDYTAADYNNCYLALMLNPPPQNLTPGVPQIIPSFFRPDLYTYWAKQPGNPTSNVALLRKILFRPNLVDHPGFTSANPALAQPQALGSLSSKFDVDNLGGGTPDSIWIDPGLPATTTRDGRTCKILVAPCILDLDGRINVNAHGSVQNTDTNVYPTAGTGATATCSAGSPAVRPTVIAGLPPTGTALLPIGQAYGPADINLNAVFSTAEVASIIGVSGGSTVWSGRYGPSSGWSTLNQPLELIKLFEFPTGNPLALPLTSFGTPPDLKGRRMLALDPRGQPVWIAPQSNASRYWSNEVVGSAVVAESPYAFKLDRSVARPGRNNGTGYDNPFTVGELETVLRQYDVDLRSLPQRLYSILPSVQPTTNGSTNSLFNPNQRNKITTDSFDLPSPNLQAPRSLRAGLAAAGLNQAFGITDLLNAEFKLNCPMLVGNNAEIAKLLPPELIAGLRMDINRPFGDGRDDRGIGLVDEPGGISSNSPSPPDAKPESLPLPLPTTGTVPTGSSGYGGTATSVPFNLVNGSSTTTYGNDPALSTNLPPGVQARQLMARHLYALMMLFADQSFYNWTSQTGLTATLARQLTARRIAQWAINVVSFRDSTSIMTPFMYHWDIYQSTYKGWLVNGDPGDPTNLTATNGNIGLVWACKPPDAVLTETLAFHDKKIADTSWDNGNSGTVGGVKGGTPPPDQGGTLGTPNFDQVEMPQGSTFIEIVCTRNPNTPFAPTDLYTNTGTAAAPIWSLNLSKMSGDNINPVWRMVVSQSRIHNPNCDLLTPGAVNSLATRSDTTTFEPTSDPTIATTNPIVAQSCQQMNLLNPGLNVPIERVVWLGATPPSTTIRSNLSPGWPAAPGAQIYYNRTGNVYVPPGSYAVIGPRTTTYVGSAGTYTTAQQWGKASQQKIVLTPPIAVTDPNGTSTMPAGNMLKASPYTAQGVVVAADPPPPATWSNATAYGAQSAPTAGIGLSVSEPLPAPPTVGGASAYYPQPTVLNSSTSAYSAYDDLTQGTAQPQQAQKYLDQPFEELGSGAQTVGGVSFNGAALPLNTDVIYKTGTTQNYKTVFLQRLADPTSGYDALRNPYITVDWMPIDLTVFNGEDLATNSNPQDSGATGANTPTVFFSTRQRGGSNPAGPAGPSFPYPNLWTPIQATDTLGAETAPTPAVGAAAANFPYKLNHTLGSLNQGYYSAAFPAFTQATAVAPQYVGDPALPFPWIAWNARPYASEYELLNVPASSPDRLLFEFNSPATPVPYGAAQTAMPPIPPALAPYGPPGTGPSTYANAKAPFGHLLNFFDSSDSSYAPGQAWNLYRVLEYLQVPSRFVGCETYLNPSPTTGFGTPSAATQYFLPPFNYVSNYRDPGRVNINTVTDTSVWNAIMNGMTVPTFAQLCDSRRGDSQTGAGVISPATTLPTYFANVFRSAAGADLVPVSGMMHRNVNATFLRAGGTASLASNPDSDPVPLFAGNTPTPANPNTPTVHDYSNGNCWVASPTGADTANTSSLGLTPNSYFAYQGLERISNLVTTRSNVFGVWLTIGYFEVVPNNTSSTVVNAGHPDGYQLGEEIGSDTGEVERHRAFYIFDRSIPVGYERGQNHNVNRAVLLKRYIE